MKGKSKRRGRAREEEKSKRRGRARIRLDGKIDCPFPQFVRFVHRLRFFFYWNKYTMKLVVVGCLLLVGCCCLLVVVCLLLVGCCWSVVVGWLLLFFLFSIPFFHFDSSCRISF